MKKKGTPANLSREAWLKAARQKSQVQEDVPSDEFSRRALAGLQYSKSEPELRQSLQRIDKRIQELTHTRRSALRYPLNFWIGVAATVILLASSAVIVFSLRPDSSRQLFAEHFEPLPNSLSAISRGSSSAGDLRSQGLLAYENEAYREAARLFEQYLELEPADDSLRLYHGVTLLALGRAEEAISSLQESLDRLQHPDFRSAAHWYLAMAMLRLKEPNQAAEQLETLIRENPSNRFYPPRARDLLAQLRPKSGSAG